LKLGYQRDKFFKLMRHSHALLYMSTFVYLAQSSRPQASGNVHF
jgi:hypothetical protein